GNMLLSFGGTATSAPLPATLETQTLARVGAGGATRLSFNGIQANADLTVDQNLTTTTLLNNLVTIPALNGNVSVSGNNGGPFVITFRVNLAGQNVSTIQSSAASNAT